MTKDTGMGFPEVSQQNLLQKYFQACKGEDRKKGTGLRLWIAKELINNIGGEIRVYSEPCVDTTFVGCLEINTSP